MTGMARGELVTDLRAMLGSALEFFQRDGVDDDAELERHLDIATADLGRFRPRLRVDTVTLQAGVGEYEPPKDLIKPVVSFWGQDARRQRKPWETHWPARLPTLSLRETVAGLKLIIEPAPTAAQMADFGAAYSFEYLAQHVIGETAAATSIRPHDRHLLLQRAVIVALEQMAVARADKPVNLGDRVSGPKNGTPAALAETLLKRWEVMAA